MALRTVNYPIAPRGLATSFGESEVPIDYALAFRNRFINAAGGAEKRHGIKKFGAATPGGETINSLHEFVKPDGTKVLFASDGHTLYKFDDSALTWSSVKTGITPEIANTRLRSVQMRNRLIFLDGRVPVFYTEDSIEFHELHAVVEAGETDSGTDQDSLQESDVTNWVTDTFVAIGDVVYNETVSAFGVITAIATASVSHTAIGSAGAATGVGSGTDNTVSRNQAAGDRYEILDTVALNVIPVSGGNFDNNAVAGTDTNTVTIGVSAVSDWGTVGAEVYQGDNRLMVGDFVRNTTRAALTQVRTIDTTTFGCFSVAGQTSGDSLIFYKHAMPRAEEGHVHYSRLYLKDTRPKLAIRISGPNDSEDFTVEAGTLDAGSFPYGAQQPEGDEPQVMSSFQRLFVIAGSKSIMLFQGTDPIADTSGASVDFDPVGIFPQGVTSPQALANIGNDLVYASPDGVQALTLTTDSAIAGRENLAEQIKTTLRDRLSRASEQDIVAFHYPRRSWFCLKVGSELYVFNYTPPMGGRSRSNVNRLAEYGSWSLFDGPFTQQRAFLVRSNGELLCAGAGGQVYEFDADDQFDDDGTNISTEYKTGWLTMDEPRKHVRIKQGHYIRPIFDAGQTIVYTIRAEGGFAGESDESILVTAAGGGGVPIGIWTIGTNEIGAAGAPVQDEKFPLRWRGKEVRITITTDDSKGPDVLSRFTLYGTQWGPR